MNTEAKYTKTLKIINIATYVLMIANFLTGLLWTPAIVTLIAFIVLHTLVRLQYLKTENTINANKAQTDGNVIQNPPMAIRTVAVIVTSLIMANLLYWLGYGLRYVFNMILG